jgi:hypothetical protein
MPSLNRPDGTAAACGAEKAMSEAVRDETRISCPTSITFGGSANGGFVLSQRPMVEPKSRSLSFAAVGNLSNKIIQKGLAF